MSKEDIVKKFMSRGISVGPSGVVESSTTISDKARIMNLLETLNEASIQQSDDFFFMGDILDTLYTELDLKMPDKTKDKINAVRKNKFPAIRNFLAKKCDPNYIRAKNVLEAISILLRKEAHRQLNEIERKEGEKNARE